MHSRDLPGSREWLLLPCTGGRGNRNGGLPSKPRASGDTATAPHQQPRVTSWRANRFPEPSDMTVRDAWVPWDVTKGFI